MKRKLPSPHLHHHYRHFTNSATIRSYSYLTYQSRIEAEVRLLRFTDTFIFFILYRSSSFVALSYLSPFCLFVPRPYRSVFTLSSFTSLLLTSVLHRSYIVFALRNRKEFDFSRTFVASGLSADLSCSSILISRVDSVDFELKLRTLRRFEDTSRRLEKSPNFFLSCLNTSW